MAGDTSNSWKDIEIRIYPDPFFTSCQISSMKKRAGPYHAGYQHDNLYHAGYHIIPTT